MIDMKEMKEEMIMIDLKNQEKIEITEKIEIIDQETNRIIANVRLMLFNT